jgi:adenylate cyclase
MRKVELSDGAVYATLPLADAAKLSAAWAERAIAIDPEDANAQSAIAYVAMVAGDQDGAREHLRLARTSNPGSTNVLSCEGFVLLFSGQPDLSRQAIMACLRLDPRGPQTASLMQLIAISHYYQHDYDKAVEAARRTVAQYPKFHLTYRWLAAALGQLGRVEAAQQAMQMAVALSPQSFEFYVRHRPAWHTPENYEHMLEGLRKAGWWG